MAFDFNKYCIELFHLYDVYDGHYDPIVVSFTPSTAIDISSSKVWKIVSIEHYESVKILVCVDPSSVHRMASRIATNSAFIEKDHKLSTLMTTCCLELT